MEKVTGWKGAKVQPCTHPSWNKWKTEDAENNRKEEQKKKRLFSGAVQSEQSPGREGVGGSPRFPRQGEVPTVSHPSWNENWKTRDAEKRKKIRKRGKWKRKRNYTYTTSRNTTVKMLGLKRVGFPGRHNHASMLTGITRLCEGKSLQGFNSKRSRFLFT